MENTQFDVVELLAMDQKRADEIVKMCYDTIAQLQLRGEGSQIAKTIKLLKDKGESKIEQFYLGFVLGRIVQTHAIASLGMGTFLQKECECMEQAMEGVKQHPEFG